MRSVIKHLFLLFFCLSAIQFAFASSAPINVKDVDNLLEVKLSSSMSVLESCTFFDCQKLQSIVMNNGFCRIDGYAISGCGQLRELQIPRTVEFMSDKSVSFCDNLEKVIMSADVFMFTKNWPFCDCPNIKEVICDGKPLTRDLFRAYMCSPCYVHISNPDLVGRYPYGEMTEARLKKIMNKLPACVK